MSNEERNVTDALIALCKLKDVQCVVQVGAEDGTESALIQEETGCRAIAIEGDSKCHPVNDKIEYYRTLIGATNCVMPFYVHNSMGLSSQLAREVKEELRHDLPQLRLDTFCHMLNNVEPDVLIIDTEGTTMDVLEGCGGLLDNINIVYAECQTQEIREGVRLLKEVNDLLVAKGMTAHEGLPSYDGGAQGNYTWVR